MKKKKQDPYGDALINVLEKLETSAFHIHLSPPKIFICGGGYDSGQVIPVSLRERLLCYLAQNDPQLYDACVQAEDFKDYFRDDAYVDLMEFEDDIALISTLIVVCLESAGALVEFGMFCNKEHARRRLLVIAPQHEVEGENSFIYLGPLKSLLRNDDTSVVIYPWPSNKEVRYEHIDLIYADIKSKLDRTEKTSNFLHNNNAHLAFLIYEIIRIANPIKLSEIELALLALNLELPQRKIQKLIYLLEVMGLISNLKYSTTTYYYDSSVGEKRVSFGRTKDGKISDHPSMIMAIRQSYVLADDEISKKRIYALKQILATKQEGAA